MPSLRKIENNIVRLKTADRQSNELLSNCYFHLIDMADDAVYFVRHNPEGLDDHVIANVLDSASYARQLSFRIKKLLDKVGVYVD